VFAAAVAAAFAPGATTAGLVETALSLAHDGTRAAIEAVCEQAAKLATAGVSCDDAAEPLRAAMEPFDTVGPQYREPGLGARRPSRLHSIEELPLALGMLVLADGDYRAAVLGGVNYGRDSDSIATMAGALAGALHGVDAVPAEWRETVGTASRLDLTAGGLTMAAVAREIHAADLGRQAAASADFDAVAGAA